MLKSLLLAVLYFLFPGQTTIPIVYSIPINNPSFETPVPANGSQVGGYESSNGCGNYFTPNVPGWIPAYVNGGGIGVWNVVDPTQCEFSPPPDGKSLLALQSYLGFPDAAVSQDLGSIYNLLPHVEGIYRLTFQVADLYYLKGWYPGNYRASLTLKDIPGSPVPIYPQVFCETSGIANGEFIAITLMCPSPPRYGELILTLSSFGQWGVVFDNVSLTFTPTN